MTNQDLIDRMIKVKTNTDKEIDYLIHLMKERTEWLTSIEDRLARAEYKLSLLEPIGG